MLLYFFFLIGGIKMAKISPQEIKDLMKSTGVGMMDCKKALEEADGDTEKAIVILREKGLATQAKKSGRVAAEGIVTSVVEGNVGAVVEVNIETDFAANNDEFKAFVAAVAKTVIEKNPADLDALKAATISGGDKSVEETLQDLFIKIRETLVTFTAEEALALWSSWILTFLRTRCSRSARTVLSRLRL